MIDRQRLSRSLPEMRLSAVHAGLEISMRTDSAQDNLQTLNGCKFVLA